MVWLTGFTRSACDCGCLVRDEWNILFPCWWPELGENIRDEDQCLPLRRRGSHATDEVTGVGSCSSLLNSKAGEYVYNIDNVERFVGRKLTKSSAHL